MSARRLQSPLGWVFRSSLVWGGLLSVAFYGLVHGLHDGTSPYGDVLYRYFANHWTLYVETVLFFVGLAELSLKALDLSAQKSSGGKQLLGARPELPQPAATAEELLDILRQATRALREGYLGRRLREALESVARTSSADRLEDQLKYLSELDSARAHSGYALVRIIIWAIPILGFLGTVIGITMAIASLSPQALEESLSAVTAGLGVAIDTTALALGLSMVLMFVQFGVDRLEDRLLADVDAQATSELVGRFETTVTDLDPQFALLRRLSDSIVHATERLALRQTEMWQDALSTAEERWSELTATSGSELQRALSSALSGGIRDHAQHLAESSARLAEENRTHSQKVQNSLEHVAAATTAQTAELSRHSSTLLAVIEATGEVTRLESALHGNLAALAGAQHLQETLLSLAGAIHLLNARLAHVAGAGLVKDAPSLVKAA